MPTKPLSELEALVGESRVTVEDFRIEAGKVEEFARAVTDSNPIYRDEAVAREAGLESIPAPLTYARVSRFPRYQVTEDGTYGFDVGFRPEYVLHGEQAYEYDRPLAVGDVLTGTTTLADVFQREGGRAGTMTFAVYETEYHDQSGERLLLDRATAIETEGAVDDGDGGAGTDGDDDDTVDEAPEPVSVDTVRSSADVAVGDTGPQIVVPDLERRHFVKYAGASGDFNPIHYDEPYARAAGNERVFGQGMFTAGVTSRVVSDWFGVDAVDSFGVRFQSRVFPGDTVVATGEVVDVTGDTVSVDLETQTAAGETLLTGSATATLEE
ncbi:FAS1-like dehydratase domain-containing protein [Natrarchaeobaculum aegyptiacum]|uniref:Dehydratase n=1 Tax=Natrarchaeobaculum aegyptiacum TaxID=745377 RepID=A0A2Z2HZA4_9EURY|nr:MaoC family dehydratase N-terminal domain-containing protein [Natrarchaeobaculum aegyptiacum]ARS91815.1 dehydratase [Natrarchaeobaculum aegyptiacum]